MKQLSGQSQQYLKKLAARALLHGVEKSNVEIVRPQRNLLLDRQNVAQSPRVGHNSSSPKMEVTITQMRKFVNVPKIHPTTCVYIPPATSKGSARTALADCRSHPDHLSQRSHLFLTQRRHLMVGQQFQFWPHSSHFVPVSLYRRPRRSCLNDIACYGFNKLPDAL